MPNVFVILLAILALIGCIKTQAEPLTSYSNSTRSSSISAQTKQSKRGDLEVVAELPFRPSGVSISRSGRIFATVHRFRLDEPSLVEVTGKTSYKAYPNAVWNQGFGTGANVLNQVNGIIVDQRDRVWVIDNGINPFPKDNQTAIPNQPPKLIAFDISTGEVAFRYNFPEAVAPVSSYPQDIAVDDQNGFVYVADIGGQSKPAIIIVNIKDKTSRRFEGHPSLSAENVDLVVEGETLTFPNSEGKSVPARIAINPITLSANNETLFYGPMNGETFWSVPTRLFREEASDQTIAEAIQRVGVKPTNSNGSSTDVKGNHYFANVRDNAIDVLTPDGKLNRLVQDSRMVWPDAVRFGRDSWLYISVNQLNRSPLLTGGVEQGKPPYLILRTWTGNQGIIGR